MESIAVEAVILQSSAVVETYFCFYFLSTWRQENFATCTAVVV